MSGITEIIDGMLLQPDATAIFLAYGIGLFVVSKKSRINF